MYVPIGIGLLLAALIPAYIASIRGYSFLGFYIFGVFLFPIALIVSIVLLLMPRRVA
jgi:hypothetical protein